MIKRFDEFNSLNESYKPKQYKDLADMMTNYQYNYVDKVFDNVVDIIINENAISEKDFKKYDDTKKYVEKYFDNNPEILLLIDKFNSEKKRAEYCAEVIYDEHFKPKTDIES